MRSQKNFCFYLALLPFFFYLLTYFGCASIPQKAPEAGGPALLEAQTLLKFQDLPVPVGFKLVSGESYAFEGAGVRVCVLKYKGRSSADQVVNFFREQMPLYNWSLLNVIEYGNRLMNFDREKESCIINIVPKGNSSECIISLGPKSQSQRKPLR